MSLATYLTEIADALREKKGTEGVIPAQSFADEILDLKTVEIAEGSEGTIYLGDNGISIESYTTERNFGGYELEQLMDSKVEKVFELPDGRFVTIDGYDNDTLTEICFYTSGLELIGKISNQELGTVIYYFEYDKDSNFYVLARTSHRKIDPSMHVTTLPFSGAGGTALYEDWYYNSGSTCYCEEDNAIYMRFYDSVKTSPASSYYSTYVHVIRIDCTTGEEELFYDGSGEQLYYTDSTIGFTFTNICKDGENLYLGTYSHDSASASVIKINTNSKAHERIYLPKYGSSYLYNMTNAMQIENGNAYVTDVYAARKILLSEKTEVWRTAFDDSIIVSYEHGILWEDYYIYADEQKNVVFFDKQTGEKICSIIVEYGESSESICHYPQHISNKIYFSDFYRIVLNAPIVKYIAITRKEN